MSAVELHLSLYVPCRSGVLQSILKKDTAEEWLASPSAATAHCRMVADRIAVAGTVVARIAVEADIAMVVVPRAAGAVEAVLVHRAAGVDPDYNS